MRLLPVGEELPFNSRVHPTKKGPEIGGTRLSKERRDKILYGGRESCTPLNVKKKQGGKKD